MGYAGPYPGPPYAAHPPYVYPQQRTGKSATVLIVIGAVLLTFGILGNFARVAADVAGKSGPGATDTSMRVGECITQSAYLAQSFMVRVVQRIDGSTDKSEFPAGTKGSASVPSPPVVYCLDKASE